jgi:hypothetical protein
MVISGKKTIPGNLPTYGAFFISTKNESFVWIFVYLTFIG